jgi:hypothetical protein
MKKRGLTVNKPNAEQLKEWNELAERLYPKVRGKLVPAETFDEGRHSLEGLPFRQGQVNREPTPSLRPC